MVTARVRNRVPAEVRRAATTGALLLAALPAAVLAQSSGRALEFVPSVSLTETYTTNRKLVATGAESESITQLSPSLRASIRSAGVQGSLDYTLTGLVYARHSEDNEIRQNLAAALSAQPVAGRVFLDARATISQQTISAFGTQVVDQAVRNDNRTQVSTVGASAAFRGQIVGTTSYDVRLSQDESRSASTKLSDSSATTVTAQLNGGGPKLGWGATLSRATNDFTAGRRTTTDRAFLSGNWSPDLDLRLSTRAGRERSNTNSATSQSSNTWGYGASWTPTERTLFDYQRDHRYFGESHSLIFQHRLARSVWRYSDTRDTTTNTSIAGLSFFDLANQLNASLIPDPVARANFVRQDLINKGLDPNGPSGTGFLLSSVALQRRQELSVLLQGVRTTLSLAAFRTDSRRLGTGFGAPDDFSLVDRIRQTGWTATVSYRLTAVSALNLSALQQRNHVDIQTLNNEQRSVNLTWSGQFDTRTGYSLGLRRVEADGANPYNESAVIGSLNLTF